ncbi:16S ribosomal RNA methyltransferase RsmE [Corynebacterium deserti GIMN1.010]|uniref:Ribosomal RNA small subunit methyltransferase E n=1 Tax=Corynebacterium deserti GIMN1.010 TaxID=931089 RepID=A0A0M4CYE6_9CORY|nr:16S rRNA (uracil(1498)-N(3))-methyltransferase [Corynebacterium deserti]ALC06450.1 16S ribosomal RNA methyltransferase RsmE [Corynebacterium deserti GIMN1.010]
MSLPVFISDTDAPVGASVTLDGPEGRHAVTVKRIQVGEKIMLIDGHGASRTCAVTALSGKSVLTAVVEVITEVPRPNPHVTIVQAIPKSERSELTIDLLTQGGADKIVAWQASRCVAKWAGKEEKSLGKWQVAAESAAKQSRRATIPEIVGVVGEEGVEKLIKDADLAIILHEEATAAIRELTFEGNVVVIIGPEGGVAPAEIDRFAEAGAHTVKLGPEVLRTASAGMVALAAIGVLSARW